MNKVLERNYQPLGNRVLIRPIENTKEDRQRGSLELPEDALVTQRADVIAVGRGEVAPYTGTIVPMELEAGDLILVRKEVPYLPVRYKGEDLKLVREADVECKLFK